MKLYLQGLTYILLASFSTLVSASALYTYTGTTFDYTHDTYVVEGAYDMSQQIIFSFATETPLLANLVSANATEVNLIGYSAEDGRQRLTSSGISQLSFNISTNSLGEITAWNTFVYLSPTVSDTLAREISSSSNYNDYASQQLCITASVKWGCELYGAGDLATSSINGAWSVTNGEWVTPDPIYTSAVPIPPSLLLLSSGILGLVGFSRNKREIKGRK